MMKDGQVNSGIFGGSNYTGTVAGPVTMQIDGGTVGDGSNEDGVYGGGYGSSTIVTGNVSVTLGESTSATDSATVNGNVYGGSAMGQTNNGSTSNTTRIQAWRRVSAEGCAASCTCAAGALRVLRA